MRRAFPVTVLFALLACFDTSALGAQAPVDPEIVESQRRLEQIRRERAQLRDEMTRIRSRVSDLSSELSNVRGQVTSSANLLRELDLQAAQRTEQIEQNTADLENTRLLLADRRAVLNQRLRSIYKRGPLPVLQVLLGADSFSDLLNRYKYLQLVARNDRSLADEVAQLETQLIARERVLRANLIELETLRRDRTSEHTELSALQRQQSTALSNVESRQRITNTRLQQLERDEASVATLIVGLESTRRAAETSAARSLSAPNPIASTLTAARMGTLQWPVEGPILYNVGRATQPNGTAVRWNGVGIGAAAGSGVNAVEAGTVVLAGPFEGYGPSVVLSHGGGYYSLYLYLRDVEVREGERVRATQRLGTVGGDRTAEGAHIEFQIRVPGGQAVDPVIWLRRR